MAHSSTAIDMTKGSIWKSLFPFSLTLLLGNSISATVQNR